MICKRCGCYYEDPVPEVIEHNGNKEIATSGWCANCNSFAMSIIYRESSAYRKKPKLLFDPMKGETHNDNP